jgi:hypothetical protein
VLLHRPIFHYLFPPRVSWQHLLKCQEFLEGCKSPKPGKG